MSRDVTGVSRANLVEVQTSASGQRFTPINRISGRVTYGTPDGGRLEVDDRRYTGDELADIQRWRDMPAIAMPGRYR